MRDRIAALWVTSDEGGFLIRDDDPRSLRLRRWLRWKLRRLISPIVIPTKADVIRYGSAAIS